MESKQGGAPVLTELNVIIEETESVHPEELGEMKTSPLFLSNIDMVSYHLPAHLYFCLDLSDPTLLSSVEYQSPMCLCWLLCQATYL